MVLGNEPRHYRGMNMNESSESSKGVEAGCALSTAVACAIMNNEIREMLKGKDCDECGSTGS